MRSTRRKKETGTREKGIERVRETGEVGEERRREAKEDSSGTGDDGGQKTSKTEARENPTRALPLPYLALLASPRLVSPRLRLLPRLVSPRLCLPARHETANTPELKLRSHANAAARLHRLLGSSSFFLPSLTRTLRPSLRKRLFSPLRSRLSLPRSLAREPFRSPAGSLPCPNARANVPVPTI